MTKASPSAMSPPKASITAAVQAGKAPICSCSTTCCATTAPLRVLMLRAHDSARLEAWMLGSQPCALGRRLRPGMTRRYGSDHEDAVAGRPWAVVFKSVQLGRNLAQERLASHSSGLGACLTPS